VSHHRAGMKLGLDSAHGEAIYDVPIEELELSVHSYNCLKRVGIETTGDLISKTESGLAAILNSSKKSVEEVRETLQAHGLTLRDE
jgi:DNA-directed RNA polymerase subunit alpha